MTAAERVLALLHEDGDWLGRVLDDEQSEQGETDPHSWAIWEESDAGRSAINLANRRIAEGLKPKNTHTAGWG